MDFQTFSALCVETDSRPNWKKDGYNIVERREIMFQIEFISSRSHWNVFQKRQNA